MATKQRKPDWLRVPYNQEAVEEVARLMKDLKLNTVCKEANCPNLGECYQKHTATFMVMGSQCTRNCRFCNVTCGRPQPLDAEEPGHVAEVAKKLGLRHVVVTQVTRDDLPDGGAAHMAAVVRAVKKTCPGTTVEVLISDLKGSEEALRTVLEARPDVMNHNVEMVKELYSSVRPQAIYERSLKVLSDSKKFAPDILTKTGFMLGLGETDAQVDVLMDDIRATGCDILTISQYLQPTGQHWPLDRYVTPEEFDRWKAVALQKGFRFVASSPLVRSSYRAAEALEAAQGGKAAAE
ncbi:MAG: lipoyl synthase [Oscillospiraceae bacterium]